MKKLMKVNEAANPIAVCKKIEADLNAIGLFKQTYEEKIDASIAVLENRAEDIQCDILKDGTLYPYDCPELQERMKAALNEQDFMA